MPLPNNGTAWPPASVHADQQAEWSAWYSGDPDRLATFYTPRTAVTERPSQFRGGVVGKVARWWWGTPTAAGEAQAKLHVPLAADICGTSADLLFSEQVGLTVTDAKTQQYLDTLQESGLDAKLHEGAEVQAALGGVYLRTVWDSTVQPEPWTEVAHPDGAVPEFRNGKLSAVVLWAQIAKDGATVWRLLERHEPGAIMYGLFQGNADNLGTLVPLPDRPETEHLAALVDEAGVQATGLTRLAVQYVPNMLPNRLHRRSPQGRSDLQGITPWLDALDEAYSSWWRDIRHAKSRLHVPAQYLEGSDGPGSSAVANVDREVYVPLSGVMAKADDGLMINAQQFAIRVEEHARTCAEWTDRIIEAAGYSTQSLSSGTGGAITAAEVHSHERRSYMTRGKKVRYWTQALRAHMATQLEVANVHLGQRLALDDVRVEFTDGVQESGASLAGTAQMLRNAEAASVRTRVALVHPDWDDAKVDAEAALILAETNGAGEPLPVPGDAGL
jgi:A118 family predicted phage portal protein